MSDDTSKKQKTRVSPSPADLVSKEWFALLAIPPAWSPRYAAAAMAQASYEAISKTAFTAMEPVDRLSLARRAFSVMDLADARRRGCNVGNVREPGERGYGAQFADRFEVVILVAGPWAGC